MKNTARATIVEIRGMERFLVIQRRCSVIRCFYSPSLSYFYCFVALAEDKLKEALQGWLPSLLVKAGRMETDQREGVRVVLVRFELGHIISFGCHGQWVPSVWRVDYGVLEKRYHESTTLVQLMQTLEVMTEAGYSEVTSQPHNAEQERELRVGSSRFSPSPTTPTMATTTAGRGHCHDDVCIKFLGTMRSHFIKRSLRTYTTKTAISRSYSTTAPSF